MRVHYRCFSEEAREQLRVQAAPLDRRPIRHVVVSGVTPTEDSDAVADWNAANPATIGPAGLIC